MAKMVDVVASKPTTEKIQTKLGYVDNMSDALAYVNFPLLIPGAVTAVLSVLFVVLATVMAYYSEQQRFTDHTMTRWLSNGGGGVKFRNECMTVYKHLPKNSLPSLLGLYEVTAIGNTLFRVATCIPVAIRVFLSIARRSLSLLYQPNSLQLRIFLNASILFGFVEMISAALLSIMTIRQDFPNAHRQALVTFAISAALHMVFETVSQFYKDVTQFEKADRISAMLKVIAMAAFLLAAPEFVHSHQLYSYKLPCHAYIPSYSALCEYVVFIAVTVFHTTALIDNRDLRIVCYPRTASGECEPLHPPNYESDDNSRYLGTWGLNQRHQQRTQQQLQQQLQDEHSLRFITTIRNSA
uniref:Frag1/DRAM/Sfk1 n=1 Tax=Syphacia muris TaxID=451379 RepID=A0A0N5AF00_9BILA